MATKKTSKKKSAVIDKASSDKKKTPFEKQFADLGKILSGEMAVEEQEKKLREMKKKAIETQKEKLRKGVVEKQIVVEDELLEEVEDSREEKIVQKIKLYEWTAPIRVKVALDMRYFIIVVALSLVFILFLAILGKYDLMAVIIALLFLIYVAGTTDPIDVTHQITTRGIETMGKSYDWKFLDQFWFSKKNDEYLMIVTTKLRYPSSLIMLLDEKEKAPLFLLLQDKLLYREIKKQGRLDVIAYGEYVPIEKV